MLGVLVSINFQNSASLLAACCCCCCCCRKARPVVCWGTRSRGSVSGTRLHRPMHIILKWWRCSGCCGLFPCPFAPWICASSSFVFFFSSHSNRFIVGESSFWSSFHFWPGDFVNCVDLTPHKSSGLCSKLSLTWNVLSLCMSNLFLKRVIWSFFFRLVLITLTLIFFFYVFSIVILFL